MNIRFRNGAMIAGTRGHSLAVWPGKIAGRAHFHKARRRPLKLKRYKALIALVKLTGLGMGGDDEFNLVIVKGVDQSNEPLCLIPAFLVNYWNAIDEDDMKLPRDGQKVVGAERSLAEVRIFEPADIGKRLGHKDRAAKDIQSQGLATGDAGEPLESVIERGDRMRIRRDEI